MADHRAVNKSQICKQAGLTVGNGILLLWIDAIKQKIQSIADVHHYKIVAMETDKDHVHILLGYDTTDSVCNIVKTLKQETTHHFWQRLGFFLSNHYWKTRIFWSDGYFDCSIGEVSSAIIQKYIENQG